jgi:hypothetical protein
VGLCHTINYKAADPPFPANGRSISLARKGCRNQRDCYQVSDPDLFERSRTASSPKTIWGNQQQRGRCLLSPFAFTPANGFLQ